MNDINIEELETMYPLVTPDAEGTGMISVEIEEKILLLEDLKKVIEKKEENLKSLLLKAMEESGISKVITERLGIYYNPKQENLEKFNKELLRETNPDIYDSCVTMNGTKKAYVTIKTK